jgi:hypothetical protein
MSVTRRLMGWLMLVICLGGCSSFQAATGPGLMGDQDPVSAEEAHPEVEVGDKVQIVLVGGEKVEGRVSEINPTSIILKDDNDIGEMNIREIRSDRIVSIEKRVGSPVKTLAIVVLVFGAFIGIVAAGESSNPR